MMFLKFKFDGCDKSRRKKEEKRGEK